MLSSVGSEALREQIRSKYAEAARAVTEDGAGCCGSGSSCDNSGFGGQLYDIADRESLPDSALLASLGCGNPLAVAELREGETVLDLGSGGGIDVLLSARRVGPTGKAYGLDMTTEMLDLAERNAAASGATNVEFVRGTIEQIPLPDSSIDVVISNCVINLSVDKPAVFAEIRRVLRPGGRPGVTDVVAEDDLTESERAERGDWGGCVAGALSVSEYDVGLRTAGFTDISLEFTHTVADRLGSAIIRARKPETPIR